LKASIENGKYTLDQVNKLLDAGRLPAKDGSILILSPSQIDEIKKGIQKTF